MWQRDFNNAITQTNKQPVGRGIVSLGESPHPLPVLHREKSLRLAARGNEKSDLWGWHGQDFWEYTKEQRCSKCSSGLAVTLEQVGQMVVVCFHGERAGEEDEIRSW